MSPTNTTVLTLHLNREQVKILSSALTQFVENTDDDPDAEDAEKNLQEIEIAEEMCGKANFVLAHPLAHLPGHEPMLGS